MALTTITILVISSPDNSLTLLSILEPTLQIPVIIIIGLSLLGSIILFIDNKKEDEFELVAYKEHLEALVQERTMELERMNALHQATIESTADGNSGLLIFQERLKTIIMLQIRSLPSPRNIGLPRF